MQRKLRVWDELPPRQARGAGTVEFLVEGGKLTPDAVEALVQ